MPRRTLTPKQRQVVKRIANKAARFAARRRKETDTFGRAYTAGAFDALNQIARELAQWWD